MGAEPGRRAAARNPSLDAVRGIAVAIVFLSHAANDGALPEWLGQGSGQQGVMLFFVLSGALMARLYGAAPLDLAALRGFSARRAGRILPAYLAVVILSVLAGRAGWPVHYDLSEPATLLASVTMISAPQELWSIPVEVQYYALFALILAGRVSGALPLSAAALGCVALAAVADRFGFDPFLPAYLPAFFLGHWIGGLPAHRLWVLSHPWALMAATALYLAMLPGFRGALGAEIFPGFHPRMWFDPGRLLTAGLVVAAAFANAEARLPGRRAWIALGTVSFGFYLIHRPVLSAINPEGPAGALLAFALSAAVAAASFRWFERPADALVRRLSLPPQPAPRPAEG